MAGERTRHKVAETDDLDDGDRVIAEIDGSEIAVFAYDGDYYALLNYCVHQAGPLCEGALEGSYSYESDDDGWEWRYDDDPHIIACPWHTWRFDITTGVCIDDERYVTPTYDVEVDDGEIFVLRG